MTEPWVVLRACTCFGRRGTTAGSGMSAKPSAAMDRNMDGLSVYVKRAASFAPPASMSAESMERAVWEKSRPPVIVGPKSVSASTVRNNRRKFSFLKATLLNVADIYPEQVESNMLRMKHLEMAC